jgi:hypothetical protein
MITTTTTMITTTTTMIMIIRGVWVGGADGAEGQRAGWPDRS